jgi:hypothetical protein
MHQSQANQLAVEGLTSDQMKNGDFLCICTYLALPAAADYSTPGIAFEELNQRLYEAPIVDKLDEIYDEVMAKANSASSSAAASVSIAAIDSSVGRSPTVAKSSKVAAYLVLGLLMPAHAVV